jgi:DNA polymerase, archaea type
MVSVTLGWLFNTYPIGNKMIFWIKQQNGFKLSYEGIYKWIAFIHSKANDNLPVPNLYFGVFTDGSLKIRGIEVRRHDTPPLFSICQNEILKVMGTGNTINEVKTIMPTKVNDIFQKYAVALKEQKVPIEELVFPRDFQRIQMSIKIEAQ